MRYSLNWIMWRANIKPTTCLEFAARNGRIFSFDDLIRIGEPRLHPNCGCRLEKMQAIEAGTATNVGMMGADTWLKYFGELPDYYITKDKAKELGWVNVKGNLSKVAPGCMIFGGIYYNDNGNLPQANGRIGYEADINYTGGYRNTQRIVFSNDGLVFVTYDHYKTFSEIIGEE